MYKQVVADLAVPLQLLDASLLQPDACSERIKRAYDRWVAGFELVVGVGDAAVFANAYTVVGAACGPLHRTALYCTLHGTVLHTALYCALHCCTASIIC